MDEPRVNPCEGKGSAEVGEQRRSRRTVAGQNFLLVTLPQLGSDFLIIQRRTHRPLTRESASAPTVATQEDEL
jgi:hypothetical protein